MSDKTKLPCIDCVCMAMCRNKPLLKIFNDCKLIGSFWVDYVDRSCNIRIATDMTSMCIIMNETLKRVFVPCFAVADQSDVISFVDIEHSDKDSEIYYERLKKTYRTFRQSLNVDMMDMPTVGPHLLPLVKDVIKSIEGWDN